MPPLPLTAPLADALVTLVATPDSPFRARVDGRISCKSDPSCLTRLRDPRFEATLTTSTSVSGAEGAGGAAGIEGEEAAGGGGEVEELASVTGARLQEGLEFLRGEAVPRGTAGGEAAGNGVEGGGIEEVAGTGAGGGDVQEVAGIGAGRGGVEEVAGIGAGD